MNPAAVESRKSHRQQKFRGRFQRHPPLIWDQSARYGLRNVRTIGSPVRAMNEVYRFWRGQSPATSCDPSRGPTNVQESLAGVPAVIADSTAISNVLRKCR